MELFDFGFGGVGFHAFDAIFAVGLGLVAFRNRNHFAVSGLQTEAVFSGFVAEQLKLGVLDFRNRLYCLILNAANTVLLFNGYTVQAGIAVGMFVGMLLIGMASIAVGVFISALTESQLVAVLLTMVSLTVMMFINAFNAFIPYTWIRIVLSWLAINGRYNTLAAGRFDFTATC